MQVLTSIVGRVLRDGKAFFIFLVSDARSDVGMEKLRVLSNASDGFEISDNGNGFAIAQPANLWV